MLDEVETLQRVRGDVRDKALNALRQLLDEIDSGRYPGLFLVITGTPAFYDGPSGVTRLPPLAQRLATDFSTDPRFDNPRAVQLRLPGFDRDSLLALGSKVRDLYAAGAEAPDRIAALVDDAYIADARRRRHRGARRQGRRRAPRVPEEARRRRPGPRRPVPRLRPPQALRADPDGRASCPSEERNAAAADRPAAPAPTTSSSTCPARMTTSADSGSAGCTRSSSTTWSTASAGRRSARSRTRPSPRSSTAATRCCSPRPRAERPKPPSFPLLTAMEQQRWDGLSVIYLCPLKALLNNLLPRLETYSGWARPPGRALARRHPRVRAASAILADPPDLLLTTPESLESMLVSTSVDHRRLFAGLRAVIVDEAHAFGGEDRGWHLLAVLERLSRIAGRPLQRIGLSATVGNPGELLTWLQGSAAGQRTGIVVAPEAETEVRQPARTVRANPRRSPPRCPQRTRTSSWTTWGPWKTPPRSSRRCTGGEAPRLLRLQAARRAARRAAAGARRHHAPDPRVAVA